MGAAVLRTLEAVDRAGGRTIARARRLSARPGPAPQGTAWVTADRWPLLARVVDRLNPAACTTAAHDELTTALAAAEVGFREVAPHGGHAGRVAVDPARAPEAEDVIRQLGELDSAWHVAPILPGVTGLPPESRLIAAPQAAGTVSHLADASRIGPALTTASGTVVVGPEAWSVLTLQPHTSLPSHANPWTADVAVDAVYTWVDGTDPTWSAHYHAAVAQVDAASLVADATTMVRFAGHRELRYSLRALEQQAGWIRHVWIVTAGQRPDWLPRDHPGVTVVDHRDLWPDAGALPTFNSHAIEANLHRIDGLAEHVLYFNDDVLLMRPATIDQYFTGDGRARVALSHLDLGTGDPHRDDPAPVAAGKNNRRLIEQTYGRAPDRRLLHVPHAFRRSHMAMVAELFADDFARTSASRFRSIRDIAPISLVAFAGLATGDADLARLQARYIDPSAPRAPRLMRRALRYRDADVLCVNTVAELGPVDTVRDFLATLIPDASTFESDRETGDGSL